MSGAPGEVAAADLVAELTAAARDLRRARGDAETAVLLRAWIDALLDEWNRRERAGGGG
ncbi:hypothetical protein [Actinokineospora iranica]|uniref:Uncharacterized protein n=1 Tax=Actinokineospora iranica TaxID=1271860 RepID=A0A1G6XBJ1_9PSEU|nr:hypothetical protein [Actinokineospora iranica]SDD75451.1 hypothetical protein SAMN05216174_11714 [Actinokineospora iranica]